MRLLGVIHLAFLFSRSTNNTACRDMQKRLKALGAVPLHKYSRNPLLST